MRDNRYIISLDIGKSKIACGIFTEEFKMVHYVANPSGRSAQAILGIAEEMVKLGFDYCGFAISGIAVASFGIIDIESGNVLSSNVISDWNHIPLRQYFETRFHVPVYVENDVKAAAYGEYCLLKGKEHQGIVYLSIGTNIGMAFVGDGVLWRGDSGRFGEICRYIPEEKGVPLGQIIGGQGISQRYYNKTGCLKPAKEIFEKALHGDKAAKDCYQDMITSTAALLCWLDICFDPGRIILGGGVVCQNTGLYQMIKAQYNENSGWSDKISLAGFGEKSGVYGAAALILNGQYGTTPHMDGII